MTITIDGHTNGGANSVTSTVNCTLSTTLGSDIIVALIVGEFDGQMYDTISSVGDTAGLTWHQRHQVTESGGDYPYDTEVWWAYSSGILSNDVITATFGGNFDSACMVAFGVNGANTSNPWDGNASLPAGNVGSGTMPPSVGSVSTNASTTMVFSFVGAIGGSVTGAAPESPWNEIKNSNAGGHSGEEGFCSCDSACLIYTSALAGSSVQAWSNQEINPPPGADTNGIVVFVDAMDVPASPTTLTVTAGASVQFYSAVPSPSSFTISAGASVSWVSPALIGGIPQQINALLDVGEISYGMIAIEGGTLGGFDVPFAYNHGTGSFETITIPGAAAALPLTPDATGDWTPPTMAVVGESIVVTHPGFQGGAEPFFGWMDISGFTSADITGNTNGNTTITALSSDVLQAGWQVGMLISSSAGDIPPNTTITAIAVGTLDLNTTADFNGTQQLTSVASLTGVVVGATITGTGIPLGTLVESLPGGGVVNMSQAATVTATAQGVNFSGATQCTISNAATGSNSGVTLTVLGGTATAPLWGAGNTNVNPLSAVPTFVAQYNGRAWFGVANGVVGSDSLNARQVFNASQALTFSNGIATTAGVGLPVTQTTGGILQALIVFQGDAQMQQITGDFATSNLAVNALGVGVGTLSPNAICQTPAGVMFIAQDGLRVINQFAQLSEPIGADGAGVNVPFINALYPTRTAASFNQDVYRVSVTNGAVALSPRLEWWYHLRLQSWSGPHTYPSALIQPFDTLLGGGFTQVPWGSLAQLWGSSTIPTADDTYVENGVTLGYSYVTALFPDGEDLAMVSVVESTLACAVPYLQSITVTATNESGTVLSSISIAGTGEPQALWGDVDWGAFIWGAGTAAYFQTPLYFSQPLVFKQAYLAVTGTSATNLEIGNLRLRMQQLGYISDQMPSEVQIQ